MADITGQIRELELKIASATTAGNDALKTKLEKDLADLRASVGEESVGALKKPSPDFEAERKRKAAEKRAINKNLKQLFGNATFPKSQAASGKTLEETLREKQAAQRKEDEERAKEYSRTHPEARKQFKEIQSQLGKKNQQVQDTAKKIIPNIGNKSVDDQIKELQLKNLKKQSQSTSPFTLPDIPKDTATAAVIAMMIATFFILAGIGTKFSQLWGYAFNAPISGAGPGGSANDSWDLPDPFKDIA